MQPARFAKPLFGGAPLRVRAAAAALKLTGRREALQALGIRRLNAAGLGGLYVCILDTAGPELAYALRAVAQGAPGGGATAFFCRHGKDRTGLLAALVLRLCGVPAQSVVADYALSDGFLHPADAAFGSSGFPGLDAAAFAAAPASAMEQALAHLDARHGGPAAFAASAGFGDAWQAALRRRLCRGGASALT